MTPLPDTALIRVARRGHRDKTGHDLEGFLVEDPDGKYPGEDGQQYRIARTCC